MFCEVVVDNPALENTDSLLYEVPREFIDRIKAGHAVLVPFGRIQQRGIVINLIKQKPNTEFRVRAIKNITFEEVFMSEWQIAVAKRISHYYATPLYKCIKLFLPKAVFKGDMKEKKKAYFQLTGEEVEFSKNAKKQQNLFLDLKLFSGTEISNDEIKSLQGYSASALKALIDKNIVKKTYKTAFRSQLDKYNISEKGMPVLTKDQEKVFKDIIDCKNPYHLIRGVTGSGKTEIYIKIVEHMLSIGKTTIILIPEIGLTPQNISRFLSYFPDKVAMWNSSMSDGEKLDEWKRIRSGEAKVIIGSRSALFTPVQDLGAIIIDEEHDQSFKQDSSPRYHANKVAGWMVKENKNALLVMGSATPSIESYYYAKKSILKLHTLESRYSLGDNLDLPLVKTVDLRMAKRDFRSPISGELHLALAETLEAREQAILLLNRRGAHNAMQCLDCGNVLKCKKCDIPYTVHSPDSSGNAYLLKCHYCMTQSNVPVSCPECKGPLMRGIGYGTQVVEQDLKERFPYARIQRMDRDTVGKKGSYKEIYEDFFNHETDILIGTQMIAKGLDIPKVSLVGIVLADIGLHIPDFRAEERIFQLLTQASGRSGRRRGQGRVIVQTYSPDNTAVMHAKHHDYTGFYDKEILGREAFNYPPFSRLVKITYADYDERKAYEKVKTLLSFLREKGSRPPVISSLSRDPMDKIDILGPSPDIYPKINGKYQYVLLLKIPLDYDFGKLLKDIPKDFRVDVDCR